MFISSFTFSFISNMKYPTSPTEADGDPSVVWTDLQILFLFHFFLSERIDEIRLILALTDTYMSTCISYRCMLDVCHSTRNGLISLPGVHAGETLIDTIISKMFRGQWYVKMYHTSWLIYRKTKKSNMLNFS